jgi:hypothetical protein
MSTQETIKVPITEEVLAVDTRMVDTGRGVRVHKTVHTEPVVVVERRVRLKEELHITRIRREEHFSRTVDVRTEEVRIERFDEKTHS